jgi:hypothetical protein
MIISYKVRMGNDENESLDKRRLNRFLELFKLEWGVSCRGDRPEDSRVVDLVRQRTSCSGIKLTVNDLVQA